MPPKSKAKPAAAPAATASKKQPVARAVERVAAAVPAAAAATAARKKVKSEADDGVDIEAQLLPSNAIFEGVQKVFEKVHQSSAFHQDQRSAVIELAKTNQVKTMEAVCDVVVSILPLPLTPEAAQRHSSFVGELSREFMRVFAHDQLAFRLVKSLLKYQNAVDKNVRYEVCSLLNVLLKAFNQSVMDDDRAELYESVCVALKHRAYDKVIPIREKAIAALCMFENATSDCDVTKVLLSCMCEDTSSVVRRQAVLSARSADIYLPHFVRLTTDVVGAVRRAAWDKLGRMKFSVFLAGCKSRRLDVVRIIGAGLIDSVQAVRVAAHNALTQEWLGSEACISGDILGMMKRFEPHCVSSDDSFAELIAQELYMAHRKAYTMALAIRQEADRRGNVAPPPVGEELPLTPLFLLDLSGLTSANVILWRACAQVLVKEHASDEMKVMPSAKEYAEILRDVHTVYQNPDSKLPPKRASVADQEQAQHILSVLLSMFRTYAEGGYFAHADDAVRRSLEERIKDLLIAVPAEDPSMYVACLILALRTLTERNSLRRTTLINDTLTLLFNLLRIPKMAGLGYDDVEQFARIDSALRAEYVRLRSLRPATAEPSKDEQKLEEDLENDTLVLLRMQRITHCYLSECRRGDELPAYCTHMIRLGRNQGDPEVRTLATYSLGLQCLMAPATVHTFMPLFVKDVQDALDSKLPAMVGEAALGNIIDLLADYTFKFFASGRPEDNIIADGVAGTMNTQRRDDDEEMAATVKDEDTDAARPRLDDCAKFGSNALFKTVMNCFLFGKHIPMVQTAAEGMCKLLACNRLPAELIPHTVAHLLLYTSKTETLRDGVDSTASQILMKKFEFFFLNWGSTHPKRQASLLEGGLLALRTALLKHRSLTISSQVKKLLTKLADITDAATLQQIRDIDPTYTLEITRRTEDANANVSTASKKTNRTSNSLSGARVWRELARNSLHELFAMELLVDITQIDCVSSQRLILECLMSLRYYRRDEATRGRMLAHIEQAQQRISPNLGQRLSEFTSFYHEGGSDMSVNTTMNTTIGYEEAPPNAALEATFDMRQERRRAALQEFYESFNAVVPEGDGQMKRERTSGDLKDFDPDAEGDEPKEEDEEEDDEDAPPRAGARR